MLQIVVNRGIFISYQRGTRKEKILCKVIITIKLTYRLYGEEFDIEKEGDNMTVRDLYIYSRDGQTFILFMKGETKFCFKGDLEYCPTELIDRLVYEFHAIDFNMIEVVLY